jgi:beta-xylosidase
MEAPTEDDLNVLRGFLATMVSANFVLAKFDICDLTLLWSNKYRDKEDYQTATREQLTKIGLPGALIDHIIRGAGGCFPTCLNFLSVSLHNFI